MKIRSIGPVVHGFVSMNWACVMFGGIVFISRVYYVHVAAGSKD